ncbi:hypothetical protein HDU96_003096 [Phlyctochytrium bullatum]|nr:hypothetical protein HDU96_003096 [Phlyctochytrium bullatum]
MKDKGDEEEKEVESYNEASDILKTAATHGVLATQVAFTAPVKDGNSAMSGWEELLVSYIPIHKCILLMDTETGVGEGFQLGHSRIMKSIGFNDCVEVRSGRRYYIIQLENPTAVRNFIKCFDIPIPESIGSKV